MLRVVSSGGQAEMERAFDMASKEMVTRHSLNACSYFAD